MIKETISRISHCDDEKPRVKKGKSSQSKNYGISLTERGYMSETTPGLQNKLLIRNDKAED